jgi:hypothetical protein
MNKQLLSFAATALTLAAAPALAFTVVAPSEPTVVVPGLESLGESRISTVQHCAAITHTNWRNLITDSDFENMEFCLREHT